jgi:hypothetical protein
VELEVDVPGLDVYFPLPRKGSDVTGRTATGPAPQVRPPLFGEKNVERVMSPIPKLGSAPSWHLRRTKCRLFSVQPAEISVLAGRGESFRASQGSGKVPGLEGIASFLDGR